ncbi:Protein of unknown function [Gryllus bimaculatus]|nr:Protein of unknown function [Gryllus bimaculatus]
MVGACTDSMPPFRGQAPKPPSAPASVIETKPPPTASAAPEIKPSKTGAAKSSDKKAAPSVAPAPPPKKPQAEAKPAPAPAPAHVAIVSSVVEVRGGPAPPPAPPSSVVEVRGPASVVASKVEVREGNTKVINLKPSSKFHKNRASAEAARPKAGNSAAPAARPRPTPTAQGPRILKTAAPSLGHKRPAPALGPPPAGSPARGDVCSFTGEGVVTPAVVRRQVALPLEQLFASQPTLQRASRRPAPAPAFSSRFHRNRAQDEDAEPATRKPTPAPAPAPAPARSARPQPAQTLRPSARKNGKDEEMLRHLQKWDGDIPLPDVLGDW